MAAHRKHFQWFTSILSSSWKTQLARFIQIRRVRESKLKPGAWHEGNETLLASKHQVWVSGARAVAAQFQPAGAVKYTNPGGEKKRRAQIKLYCSSWTEVLHLAFSLSLSCSATAPARCEPWLLLPIGQKVVLTWPGLTGGTACRWLKECMSRASQDSPAKWHHMPN